MLRNFKSATLVDIQNGVANLEANMVTLGKLTPMIDSDEKIKIRD